jgi:hypothetical protein
MIEQKSEQRISPQIHLEKVRFGQFWHFFLWAVCSSLTGHKTTAHGLLSKLGFRGTNRSCHSANLPKV